MLGFQHLFCSLVFTSFESITGNGLEEGGSFVKEPPSVSMIGIKHILYLNKKLRMIRKLGIS